MVNQMTEELNQVFYALSDPTRRAIIAQLSEKDATVSELAEPFAMSLPAVSKHVRVLEKAGLVDRRITGRVHHLSLNAGPMQSAADWLATYRRFWLDSFDALAGLIEDRPKE